MQVSERSAIILRRVQHA